VAFALPLTSACEFYFFLHDLPASVFYSRALVQQLRGAIMRRMGDVPPTHAVSEFTVSKMHATDSKQKRLTILPLSLQTEVR